MSNTQLVLRYRTKAEIAVMVASHFEFTASDLLSNKRNADIIMARNALCAVLRGATKLSYPAIANFVNRDHSTVMHAEKRCNEMMAKDHIYYRKVSFLKNAASKQIYAQSWGATNG